MEQGNIKNKLLGITNQYKEALESANKTLAKLENEKKSFNQILNNKEKIIIENREKIKSLESFIEDNNNKVSELESTHKQEIEENNKKNKIEYNKVVIIANKRKELVESFQQKNLALDEKLKNFQNEVTLLQEKNLVLDEKINSFQSEVNLLTEDKNNLEKEILNKSNELLISNKLFSENKEEYKKTISDLEKNLNEMSNENIELQNINTNIKNEITIKSSEIDTLKEKIDEVDIKLGELFSENESFYNQILDLKTKNNEINQENTDLIQKYNSINQDKENLSIEYNKIFQEKDEIYSKYGILTENYNTSLNKIKSLDVLIDEKELLINNLNMQIENDNENIKNKKEKIETLETRIDDSDKIIAELSKKIETNKNDNDEYFSNLDSLKNENIELSQKLAYYENSIISLESDNNSNKEEINNLNLLNKENEKLFNDKIDNLNSELRLLRLQKEKDISLLISEKNESENRVKVLEDQVENLKSLKNIDFEKQNNQVSLLSKENFNLKNNYSNKEIEVEIAKQDINSLKNIVENLRSQIYKAEKDFFEIEANKNELKILLSEKERENEYKKIEVSDLREKIEIISKNKNKEIESLYNDINNLNSKILEYSKLSPEESNSFFEKLLLEKSTEIDNLREERNSFITKIEELTKTIRANTEVSNNFLSSKQKNIEELTRDNKESNLKILSYENRINEKNNNIIKLENENRLLKETSNEYRDKLYSNEKEFDELKLKIQSHESEIKNIIDSHAKKEVTFEKKEVIIEEKTKDVKINIPQNKEDKKDNIKVEYKKEDYISIDELYNETISSIKNAQANESKLNKENDINFKSDEEIKLNKTNLSFEEIISENMKKESPILEDIKDEEINFDISHIEFDDDKSIFETKTEKSEPFKQPVQNINKPSTTNNIKPNNVKIDRASEILHNSKKQKIKTSEMIFIMGGSKELEEKWKNDIEKTLEEYGYTHQWISSSEKDLLRTSSAKGVVFIISANSIQYLENFDLITRNISIPSIKYVLTNMTKLKIDIIDNFIRKKVFL
ncbi:MAG: hypothetical protein AABZ74_03295 [Cyanobacteriota bacterium]